MSLVDDDGVFIQGKWVFLVDPVVEEVAVQVVDFVAGDDGWVALEADGLFLAVNGPVVNRNLVWPRNVAVDDLVNAQAAFAFAQAGLADGSEMISGLT